MPERVRVSTERLRKLSLRRGSRRSVVAVAGVAVAGLLTLVATQTTAAAATGTDATRANYLEGCPSGQACLWIHALDESDPTARADRRALVIKPGAGPDLDAPTPYGQGKVHGVTEEFTDNISVGWNNLPTELCLLDTEEYSDGEKFGTKAPLRHATHITVVPPWSDFSKLGARNDTTDYYTTGQCPRGDIIFRTDTEAIVDAY